MKQKGGKKVYFERGDKLQLVLGNGINWAKEGDMLVFVRKSKEYEKDKGLGVTDENGNLHFINEYRVSSPFGDKKAVAKCRANAPKLHVVLQDSCSNYIGSNAVVGLDEAEKVATDSIQTGEPLTIYELTPVKKVAREPVITDAE